MTPLNPFSNQGQGQGQGQEWEPVETPFFTSLSTIRERFKKQFGRDVDITGGATKKHMRPQLGGQAVDIRSRDLTPEQSKWLAQELGRFGVKTLVATGKESWATGPHIHAQATAATGDEWEPIQQGLVKAQEPDTGYRKQQLEKARVQLFDKLAREEPTPAEKALPVVGPLLGKLRRSIPGRIATTAVEGIGLPAATESLGAFLKGGPIEQAKHLFTTVKGLGDAQWQEYKKARELMKERGYKDARAALGSDPEIAQHFWASVIPLVGPYASSAVEDLKAGRTTEGLTKGALILAPFAIKGVKGIRARTLAHEKFGPVTIAEEQSGVTKGKLKVVDEAGAEHIIQNPRTVGNRQAAFTKTTEGEWEPVREADQVGRQQTISYVTDEKGRRWRVDPVTGKPAEIVYDPAQPPVQPPTQGEIRGAPDIEARRRAQAEELTGTPNELLAPKGVTGKPLPPASPELKARAAKTHQEVLESVMKPKPEVPKEAGKEPWEMSADEFTQNIPIKPIGKTEAAAHLPDGTRFRFDVPADVENVVDYGRKRVIQNAIKDGKPVPPEVLADYPDLAKQAKLSEVKAAAQAEPSMFEEPIVEPPKFGPGAQNLQQPQPPNIAQLRSSLAAVQSPPATPIGRGLSNLRASAQTKWQNLTTKAQGLGNVAQGLWQWYKSPAPWTNFKQAIGDWQLRSVESERYAADFAREIKKQIPSVDRRRAISAYIESGGDLTKLQDWQQHSLPRNQRAYELAQNLTPEEQVFADNVRNYFDSMLLKGQQEGIIEGGVENYLNHVYKGRRNAPAAKNLRAEVQAGLLDPNFKFGRERFYENLFEAEQSGLIPEKDIGYLITVYDKSFNKALNDRAFIRQLWDGRASDGRPLLATSGYAKRIEGEPIEVMEGLTIPSIEAYLVKPTGKPFVEGQRALDYVPYDHPALRKWKWVERDLENKPIFLEGNLLVHPEIAHKYPGLARATGEKAAHSLPNVLGRSGVADIPFVRGLLKAQSTLKQTMLSLSPFHQVQEAVHAIGHKVNPAFVADIDLTSPVQRDLVTHGLNLPAHSALQEFSEGLSGGALTNKLPIVGKRLFEPYQQYLFQDYIPRLKMQMALDAFERNSQRYAGKLSRDQILELTANQANAAFGELNYRMMGRNPNVQAAMRAVLLAPDFLEARGRFAAQALKPFGAEQGWALARLAGGMYVGARVLNAAFNNGDMMADDPKMAFAVKIGHRTFSLRSVPGDIQHLISDPRGFLYWRTSPFARGGIEALTGRDVKGEKRSLAQQAKDFAKSTAPIPFQSYLRGEDRGWWENFLQSTGANVYEFYSMNERKRIALSSEIKDQQEKVNKIKGKLLRGGQHPSNVTVDDYMREMTELQKLKQQMGQIPSQ